MTKRKIDQRLRDIATRPLSARIAFWSRQLLGTRYRTPAPRDAPVLGPNLCAVDCETYVEQVIALARSRHYAEFPKQLRALRFVGGTPLPALRHFTVTKSWLADSERAHILQDITRQVGGPHTRILQRALTPVGWSPRYLIRYFALGVHAPLGAARLPYLPMSVAIRARRRIPSGTILHVVAAPHPRSPYLATHVGIVLHTRFGLIFRHASRSPRRRRVEDRPLGPYLYYIQRTPAGPEMRKGIGIHLSRVLDRLGPRPAPTP